MEISIRTRLKCLFARDKEEFWFNHFSDYELKLSKMDITELASELNRTKVRHETENTTIVEYFLSARLAHLQSRGSWWSGWLSFAGAMLAAALTFYLGQLSIITTDNAKIISAPSYKAEERSVKKPIQPVMPSVVQDPANSKTVYSHTENRKAKK